MQKVALYISGAIFAAAFIHLARLIAGFEIIVGEIVVPVRMGIVMYGRPRCCKGKTDLKRR